MKRTFAIYESRTILLLVSREGNEVDLKSKVSALRIKRPSTRDELSCPDVDIEPVDEIESEASLSAYVVRESLRLLHNDLVAVFGFIRFGNHAHLILISKTEEVGSISGNSIFCIKDTVTVPLTYRARSAIDETSSQNTYAQLDIIDNFYFSPNYQLTNTYQHQCLHADRELQLQEKFVWNWHLLQPLLSALKHHAHSCIQHFITPFIYGYVKQYILSLNDDSDLLYTLISRRSVGFAGVRHLRRGVNSNGEVGNEIETEQIITLIDKSDLLEEDSSSTSASNAYVQVRGSIPLCWHHINYFAPQPGITLESDIDPALEFSKLHYDSLLERYGRCIHVVSLLRQTAGREFNLHNAHRETCEQLQLQHSNRMLNFFEFDLLKHAKHTASAQQNENTREQEDGLQPLLEVLEAMVLETGICTLSPSSSPSADCVIPEEDKQDHPHLQHGVVRTNCIDCLDRTNLVQFLAAQFAVSLQLAALDVSLSLEQKSAFEEHMLDVWMEHGDRIALQYAGSAAMHRLERRQPQQKAESPGGTANRHRSSTNALLNLKHPGNDSRGSGLDSVFVDSEADVSPTTAKANNNLAVVSNLVSNALIALQRYCGNLSVDFDRQRAIDMMLGWHDASVECYPEYHRVAPARPEGYLTVKDMHDLIANEDSHHIVVTVEEKRKEDESELIVDDLRVHES